MLTDGTYVEASPDGADEILNALTAASENTLLYPPRTRFQNPNLDRPTPLTVTADSAGPGYVYGHIAPWEAEHTGIPGLNPPRSPSNYAFFRTGVVATAEGDEVPVGQITLAGGHCNDLTASSGRAVQHYDDTASAVADVNVGEDDHGIWVAGSLRPGVTPEQVRALRASAPSGDWRPINGHHELIAICQVNSPGFPLARTVVASGEMQAIVAAGASAMYMLRQQDAVLAAAQEMEKRLTVVEDRIASLAANRERSPRSDSHTIPAPGGSVVFNVTAGPDAQPAGSQA